MTIAFISNFMSSHQLPLSESLLKRVGTENYTFIATEPMSMDRLNLGFTDVNHAYDFILCTYESEDNMKKAQRLLLDVDVLIWGSAPYEFVEKRLQAKKMTFKYSERIFRKGKYSLLKPSNRKNFETMFGQYRDDHFYLLATGAFSAHDFSVINAFPNKALKWGYFPPFIERTVPTKKDPMEIVWCARFIDVKHPESIVHIAEKMKKDNFAFHITMIGNGPLFDTIQKAINKKGLNKEVSLIGSVSSEKVRGYMDKASIFLFTSDKGEGWGAVINEAMNSGCVPIISHEIGGAPYLVKHGENGYIFKSKNWDNATIYIERLLSNRKLCEEMSEKSYKCISEKWNSENAAERLIDFCKNVFDNRIIFVDDGPCSKAELTQIKDILRSIQ